MSRPATRVAVLAVIFFFVGVGTTAAGLAAIPDPGSAPSIYDDFSWSSTANGFWHVNAVGATAVIKDSLLTLRGHSIELDRRVQTDPYETVAVAKVRGIHFHKFDIGIGAYHAGTIGIEFDDDGVKCGRGTDFGWKIDFMKAWQHPPAGQWFYLEIAVTNPYPTKEALQRAEDLAEKGKKLKVSRVTCSMYDSGGHLVTTMTPMVPPPNAHYVGLDEAFLRTWDSGNDYQVDWFYTGPPSGIPASANLART